ncbi:MAG TPA: methyltransferase, TIGR04325 family [Methylophilaceae bacterium]|jgi:putative methyltransferase (TIGR04325 family)|nr:methyltransferase, TIGR04325 family [Methylophilaceae bacterium]
MSADREFHIWEGVYQHWDDAPQLGDAFNNEKWLAEQAAAISAEISDQTGEHGTIPACAISRDYILPVIAALAVQQGHLKILDFGGGLASSYPLVMGSIPGSERIEFHVVEGSGICERGRKQFAGLSNLQFHTSIPKEDAHFDIVHAGRSFQYIDDWRALLTTFSNLRPRYLVLAGLLAGDISPFVSLQNYYGCKIRVRFLNRDELIKAIEQLGFRLVYKSLHLSKRLGKEGPLPMGNFSIENRLEHPCQLLFEWVNQ